MLLCKISVKIVFFISEKIIDKIKNIAYNVVVNTPHRTSGICALPANLFL
jgi:hypothetical protein